MVAALLIAGSAMAAESPMISSLQVVGSPFSPTGKEIPTRTTVRLALDRSVVLTVTVTDFGGRIVRTLAWKQRAKKGSAAFAWDGRDDAKHVVPDGAYRFQVKATAGGVTTEARSGYVTKAPVAPYPLNPGAIVVALDPGHGGPDQGATAADGSHEDTYNLDIAQRLAAMLRGAGVRVVMTRTKDVSANPDGLDLTPDGELNFFDELQARVDIENLARADLAVSIHNNSVNGRGPHGTITFCRRDRPYGDQSCRLGRYVQARIVAALQDFSTATWAPLNRGVYWNNPFFVLMPWGGVQVMRASGMAAILVEGLFVSNDGDLAKLQTPAVRQAIAAGTYKAIALWLNSRPWGARYAVLDGPARLASGETGTYTVVLTNRGMQTLPTGTTLEARIVPSVPYYDGRVERAEPGPLVGSAVLSGALEPGASVRLTVPVVAPPFGGSYLVQLGATLPDRTPLYRKGVVVAQRLLEVDGPPAPTVTPSPTPIPTATPVAFRVPACS